LHLVQCAGTSSISERVSILISTADSSRYTNVSSDNSSIIAFFSRLYPPWFVMFL
jgi:hypothetical protein